MALVEAINRLLVTKRHLLPEIDDAHFINPCVCKNGCMKCADLCNFICTEINLELQIAKRDVRIFLTEEGLYLWEKAINESWHAACQRKTAVVIRDALSRSDMSFIGWFEDKTWPGVLYRRDASGRLVPIESSRAIRLEDLD